MLKRCDDIYAASVAFDSYSTLARQTEHRDLCSTCNHAPTCGNRGTPDRPIFFCELFEAFGPVEAAPALARPAASPKQETPDRLMGLCSNCDNRQSCTIKKPGSGIWHCEEYC